MPPWKIWTDKPPNVWERFVWISRRNLYTNLEEERNQRRIDEMRNNGG